MFPKYTTNQELLNQRLSKLLSPAELSELLWVHHTATLRDQFAMAAISGMLATETDQRWFTEAILAKNAYKIADAMLAERKMVERCRA